MRFYKKEIFILTIAIIVLLFPGVSFADSLSDFVNNNKYALAHAANNIVQDLGGDGGAFDMLYVWFVYLVGLVIIFTGIKGLTRQDTPKGGAIAAIMIGTCIMGIPQFLRLLMGSVFNETANVSIMSAIPPIGDQVTFTTVAFVNFAFFIIQVVGFVAVYRGLKTLADVSLTHQRQPQQIRAAWIYIFAGVLCINIIGTIKMIAWTLIGTGVSQVMVILDWLKKLGIL